MTSSARWPDADVHFVARSLLFLDGHADFYQPSAEPSGEAASMDLALATGYGPPGVGDLEGRSPLVR